LVPEPVVGKRRLSRKGGETSYLHLWREKKGNLRKGISLYHGQKGRKTSLTKTSRPASGCRAKKKKTPFVVGLLPSQIFLLTLPSVRKKKGPKKKKRGVVVVMLGVVEELNSYIHWGVASIHKISQERGRGKGVAVDKKEKSEAVRRAKWHTEKKKGVRRRTLPEGAEGIAVLQKKKTRVVFRRKSHIPSPPATGKKKNEATRKL